MKKKKAVKNTKIENGFAEAIGIGGGFNNFGFPGNQGTGFTPAIEDARTLFKNLRWYFISNDRQLLCQMYVELGLVQTIVDVPVDDALRGGITIKSKQLEEKQLEELEDALDRENDLNALAQAAKWARLFGGAGTLVLTDQDPETPLDMEAIGPDEALEFRACDMWELYWNEQNAEGFNPAVQDETFEFYDYYGVKVHKSRVMRMKGLLAPAFLRPRLRGWGFSVVEALVRSINQYIKATDLAFQVLDEFKIDVFKIKNLTTTLLQQNGTQKVRERVQLANYEKNYLNALTMDSEDDWDHKQLSFAGLGDAMKEIRMQVAADMRMPITKLFGLSSTGGGLNSSQDDIEVYNSMIESQIRNKIKYDALKIVEIRCKQKFGYIPDDLSIEFAPLRIMSSDQEETVKTQKFTRLLQAQQGGLISPKEFRDACNKSDLFDISLEEDPTLEAAAMAPAQEEGPNKADSEGGKATKNSAEFDRASYEADGGDSWIDDRRKHFFENPKDRGLWEQIKQETQDNWKYSVWLYQKRGGKF